MTISLRPHSFPIHPAPGRPTGSSGPVVAAVIKSGRGYRIIRRVRLAPAAVPRRVSLWQRVVDLLRPAPDAEQLYAHQTWRQALHQESWSSAQPVLLGGQLVVLPGSGLSRFRGVADKGGL